LGLQAVAAEILVLLLHLPEPSKNPVHFVRVTVLHGALQTFQFVMQIAGPAAAGDGFIQNRPAAHFFYVLPEIPDREPLRNSHLAFVRRFFADHHAKQRRLTGAVRSDQADFFSGVQLEGCVHEDQLLPVLLMDIRKRNHSEVLPQSRPSPPASRRLSWAALSERYRLRLRNARQLQA
jgi:hypothetical protein